MRACKGFTIVEILVCLLILSLLVGAIFMVLNTGDIVFTLDIGMLELQQQLRQAMDLMVRELRQAQDVMLTVEDDNSDRITFNTASAAGISYYRNLGDNQLIREYPAGTTKVLANNIAYFKCALAAGLLEIQLRAEKTVRQKLMTFSWKEKVKLRNE